MDIFARGPGGLNLIVQIGKGLSLAQCPVSRERRAFEDIFRHGIGIDDLDDMIGLFIPY